MSFGKDYLHSHSALERELKFPKHTVLVDAKYEPLFAFCESFKYKGKNYCKVPIRNFVSKGGVFKNLMD